MAGQALKIANYQRPVELLEIAQRKQAQSSSVKADGESFKDMFSRELGESRPVVISRHASARLHSRGINLDDAKMNRIADAIDKAEIKGSKETLILDDEVALVVSVENRTVITAFDRNNLKEGVITSIDSAVIL